jgi:hypothetical protein
LNIHLGTNHRWAYARQDRPANQVVTWDNPDGTTSSVTISEPDVAAWLAAGNEPVAAAQPDPGPPVTTIEDLERRVADLEKQRGA